MVTSLISKIQRYSTKDGPGIRSTVFFVGCNLKCLWCSNPELIAPGKKLMHYHERCQLCYKCTTEITDGSVSIINNQLIANRSLSLNLVALEQVCPYNAFEVIGKEVSAAELCSELLKDKDYFLFSGGGVTFSGGEALLHSEFLAKCCAILKSEGIHLCLDTAGLISEKNLLKIAELVDLILVDIKAFSSELHQKCTEVTNELILRNIKSLATHQHKMIIRLLIAPNYNDDFADVVERLKFIQELGAVVCEVNILPYHNYGKGKYQRLGLSYSLKEAPIDWLYLEKIEAFGKRLGLNINIHKN